MSSCIIESSEIYNNVDLLLDKYKQYDWFITPWEHPQRVPGVKYIKHPVDATRVHAFDNQREAVDFQTSMEKKTGIRFFKFNKEEVGWGKLEEIPEQMGDVYPLCGRGGFKIVDYIRWSNSIKADIATEYNTLGLFIYTSYIDMDRILLFKTQNYDLIQEEFMDKEYAEFYTLFNWKNVLIKNNGNIVIEINGLK